MIDKILIRLIKIAAVLAVFTPLYVDGSFIFPFVFPKTAAFQVLVEIMFFAWLTLAIYRPEFRPKKSRIIWALGIFLLIVFLASLLGANFQLSFWSSYERMTGFLTQLHYFAFFVVLTSVLKTKKDWLMIFDFFIAAGILLSLFGLGQKFGVQGLLMSGAARVSGTFGNPAYFSAYLIFVLAVVLFMFFQRPARGARYYYAGAFALNFLVLYWTETRGALLGFGAALILFLIALMLWPKEQGEREEIARFKSRIKKTAMIILAGFAVFVIIFFAARDTALIRSSSTLRRLADISLSETTTQTRLLAWKLSWKGFSERPILGWGWENYNVVFNKYYDPELFPVENWFDRAHNIVFDTLVATGALGFIGYIGIFVAICLTLWRAFKRKKIDFLNASLFAVLLVAYFVQNLFVFDMLYSYLPLFLVFGFINWIGREDKTFEPVKTGGAVKFGSFGAAAIVATFIFLIYAINIKPALASWHAIRGLSYAQAVQQDARRNLAEYSELAANELNTSLDYGTFGRFEARLQLFETAKNLYSNYDRFIDKTPIDALMDLALVEGDKVVVERPMDARYLLSVGQLNLVASRTRPERMNAAADYIDQAYRLSQTKQIILFTLAEVKIKQGKTDEGLGFLKKAVELNPQAIESHWSLAQMHFALGDLASGEKILAEMEERFGYFYTTDKFVRIANYLAMNQKLNDAIAYQQKALVLEPKNADLYATLAGLYAEAGDKISAKDMALKAVELNPAMKEQSEQFINSLGL